MKPEWAPLGAKRFLDLIKDKFYDGTALFRALPGFLLQFGIHHTQEMNEKWVNNVIRDDPMIIKPFPRGGVSFAGSGANSRTTQAFISFSESTHLGKRPWETPFGVVDEAGMKLIEGGINFEYGEKPDQGEIHEQGYNYLHREFPLLSYFSFCRIEDPTPHMIITTPPPPPPPSSSSSASSSSSSRHDPYAVPTESVSFAYNKQSSSSSLNNNLQGEWMLTIVILLLFPLLLVVFFLTRSRLPRSGSRRKVMVVMVVAVCLSFILSSTLLILYAVGSLTLPSSATTGGGIQLDSVRPSLLDLRWNKNNPQSSGNKGDQVEGGEGGGGSIYPSRQLMDILSPPIQPSIVVWSESHSILPNQRASGGQSREELEEGFMQCKDACALSRHCISASLLSLDRRSSNDHENGSGNGNGNGNEEEEEKEKEKEKNNDDNDDDHPMLFEIKHPYNGKCWVHDGAVNSAVRLGNCSRPNAVWLWEKNDEHHALRHALSGLCVHPKGGAPPGEGTELVGYTGCLGPRIAMTISRGFISHSNGKCVRAMKNNQLQFSTQCVQPFLLSPPCILCLSRSLPSAEGETDDGDNDDSKDRDKEEEEEEGGKKKRLWPMLHASLSRDIFSLAASNHMRIRHAEKAAVRSAALPLSKRPQTRKSNPLDKSQVEWVKSSPPPRVVKNPRPLECDEVPWNFPPEWTASLVICYRDEPVSVLVATLTTIMYRTPPNMLDEIILIDEASSHPEAITVEQVRALNIPKLTLIRNAVPNGLMRCRMQGAALTKSPVLVFLDSHIEVMEGWLEPMLQAVQVHGVSAVPVVDSINYDNNTGQYTFKAGPSRNRGSMDWKMIFRWETVPEYELDYHRPSTAHLPFMDPVMVGGLFAISRARWEESGQYDTDMEVWGAENLEMSFREWMCGGQIYVTPCSHIAHLFKKKYRYKFDRKVVWHNNDRTALVWMDQFAEIITTNRSHAFSEMAKQDVRQRILLRKRLGCRSFQWYLDTINPRLRDKIPEKWKHLLHQPQEEEKQAA